MNGRTKKMPRLADTLGVLLPTETDTRLLRACLLTGPAVRESWEQWLAAIGGAKEFLRRDGAGVKRHLPLLYENLGRAGASIPRDLQPYLRTAHMREELRAQRYHRHFRESIAILTDQHVDFLLVKGGAVSEIFYPAPTLRHCHDIDVLVHPDQVDKAVQALVSSGPWRVSPASRMHDLKVNHESGLPIELHTRMFACPFYPNLYDEIRARSQVVSIMDIPTRTTSPADTLVHLCVHAFGSRSRNTLAWVCDSCLLLRCHPDMDWSAVGDLAKRGRVELPLLVMLQYLSERLDAPVPPAALEELRTAAARSPTVLRDAAIDAARTAPRGSLTNMLRSGRLCSRLDVLRWMLLPTPSYLRWACHESSGWRVPLWYFLRPIRFIGRRFRRASVPLARPGPDSPMYSPQ